MAHLKAVYNTLMTPKQKDQTLYLIRKGRNAEAVSYLQRELLIDSDQAQLLADKLQEDGGNLGVELKFNNIEDFEPDNVVQQVEPLRKLVEARQKLSDLLSKMDGNEKLVSILNDVISNSDKQKELSDSLGLEGKQE